MPDVYTNEKSAETKIREALVYQLGLIATDNENFTYLNDVATVLSDFPEDPDSISSYPALAVLTGYEHRDHYDNETLYVSLKVPLIVFVDPEGTVFEEIESIKQDIHRVIGNHPGLEDSEGNTTCQLAIFSSAEPFGKVLDMPLAGNKPGVKFILDITYQQRLEDPTVN